MQLLLRVVMLARCMLSLCVCPSVRHTTESHRNTSLIHGHRGRSFLQRVHTRGGVGWNWRSLTNISLYLRNGTRYGNIYYRTLIGTDVSSIKWRYFQWLWVTPNYLNHSIFAILYRLSYLCGVVIWNKLNENNDHDFVYEELSYTEELRDALWFELYRLQTAKVTSTVI